MRLFTVMVVVAVVTSFALASLALKSSIDERNARIHTTEIAIARSCQRQEALAAAITRDLRDDTLVATLRAIDARYPELRRCELYTLEGR